MQATVRVRVPATTANIGPGYDAFGLALGLYDEFAATPAPQWSVTVQGEGEGSLADDESNVVVRAMALGLELAGRPGVAASIECHNEIPPGRGLGSSAAAIVGGLMLADALSDGALGREAIFEQAVRLEGHADNAAAALLGGFTIGWEDRGPRATGIEPAAGLAAIVVIAEWELPTLQARGMLPREVPHADAAFNAGRAGLVAAAIATGRGDLLRAGLHDKLHQPYRAAAVHDFELVTAALLDAGADGAVLSGAGPTVIGLITADSDEEAFGRAEQIASAATRPLSAIGGRRPPVALAIDRGGALVV